MVDSQTFQTKKSLGQNFILDTGFLNSIVERLDIQKTDTIVEIGTGRGTLTKCIAKYAKRVVTIEIDTRLRDILESEFAGIPNIELVFADVLKHNLDIAGDFKIVANIPYYITTPIIMKFLKTPACKQICVLVQDDVAKRIVAPAGTGEYGALSVSIQAQAECKILKFVKRTLFHPAPNVDSAFVVINKTGATTPDGFDVFIKDVFSRRRKKISNSVPRSALLETGVNPDLRPEQIPVDLFVKICAFLTKNPIK
jgi:16S rRNA (adenine1518-N6/adenine1519-N6)-dimethyltransferase